MDWLSRKTNLVGDEGGDQVSPTKPFNLLIVDDDALDRSVVRRALGHGGHPWSFQIIEASSLANARCLLQESAIDLALLDINLPDGNGLELIPTLREFHPQAAIVMITGLDDQGIASEALREGVQDYLIKADLVGSLLVRCVRYALERKRADDLRAKMIHAERLASLGTLSAGVAHEINNPLQAVLANLSFATDDLVVLDKEKNSLSIGGREALWRISDVLSEADRSCHRIRKIVADLQRFSHPHDDETRVMFVRESLEMALTMAAPLLRTRASLVVEFGDVPPVRGNPTRLSQVFLNLLVNAAQAIPEGQLDRNQITVGLQIGPRGEAVVRVQDSGAGIPAALHSRIFEPFFTTKAVGSGTGLGLSICAGIVRSFAGRIEFESQPGLGSVFRVLLPPAHHTHQHAKGLASKSEHSEESERP